MTPPFIIPSQTSRNDQLTLLSVQAHVAARNPGYCYVEVGSHLGGSLLPHLHERQCARAFSIDPRPASQPDERGQRYHYKDNSTARMRTLLASEASNDEMAKLSTFDATAESVAAHAVMPYFELAFIDGEHTVLAVVSDFLALLPFAHPRGAVILFHDSNLIFNALLIAEKILDHNERRYVHAFFADSVYGIAIGSMMPGFDRVAVTLDRAEFLARSERELAIKRKAAP